MAMETLKRCELFLGLNDRDIQKIADLPSCQAKTYKAGEVIFEAGEEAKLLYMVEEGEVQLALKLHTPSQPPELTVVRTVTRGGIFGWAALVPPPFRMMSAISKGSSKVISISGNELRALFEKDASLGYEVMESLVKVIASRVWNIEQLLISGKGSPFVGKATTVWLNR